MLAIPLKSTDCTWRTLSFVSTLYIRPILDQLILEVPHLWQAEVRLGLHEALINAARHGNQLDQHKKVVVHYSLRTPLYQWIIEDQGCGFSSRRALRRCHNGEIAEMDESGRGIFMLTQIFDHVEWNECGNQLYLDKAMESCSRLPRIF